VEDKVHLSKNSGLKDGQNFVQVVGSFTKSAPAGPVFFPLREIAEREALCVSFECMNENDFISGSQKRAY
jgi:hypothetical protein